MDIADHVVAGQVALSSHYLFHLTGGGNSRCHAVAGAAAMIEMLRGAHCRVSQKTIVTWNIRHGGGGTERSQKILSQLGAFNADLLVVTEFRNGPTGAVVRTHLASLGYSLSHPNAGERANSVLVACRQPIRRGYAADETVPDKRHLWIVELDWLTLCAVYMPNQEAKLPYWRALERLAQRADGPDLFLGDFNTGNNALDLSPGGALFIASDYFDRFGSGRLVDVWRARNAQAAEFSWFSRSKNGFRLDHAFASSTLNKKVRSCEYQHEPRTQSLSDHSALLLTIDD